MIDLSHLTIQVWPIGDLIPFDRNARTHSEEQVAQVVKSIREFKWTNPILVGADRVIIAGHARLEAARFLKMTEVPVIVLPHLSVLQRRALVIADNQIAANDRRLDRAGHLDGALASSDTHDCLFESNSGRAGRTGLHAHGERYELRIWGGRQMEWRGTAHYSRQHNAADRLSRGKPDRQPGHHQRGREQPWERELRSVTIED